MVPSRECVCMRGKEKNVSQPHCPGPRIIKGEGNNGMVWGFLKTQQSTELVRKQFKMKFLVRFITFLNKKMTVLELILKCVFDQLSNNTLMILYI